MRPTVKNLEDGRGRWCLCECLWNSSSNNKNSNGRPASAHDSNNI